MPKIHVLLKKEELDNQRLAGKVVVVLDILFATTSIVAALANGAKDVVPLPHGKAALAEAEKREAGTYILSGELHADTLPGFCHSTPLALVRENVVDRSVLYCTTNGTVAVHKARHADQVYAAALINGRAVVQRIVQEQGDETVLIVCSGSADNFNLEDFYGAGHFIALFSALAPGRYEFTDAAIAAEMLYAKSDAVETLKRARIGRLMMSRGLEAEIKYAARQDCFDVVPRLVNGVLRTT